MIIRVMKELNTKKKFVNAMAVQDTSPWIQPTSCITEAITNGTQNRHRHKSEIDRFSRKKNGARLKVVLRAMVATTMILPTEPSKRMKNSNVTYKIESIVSEQWTNLNGFTPLAMFNVTCTDDVRFWGWVTLSRNIQPLEEWNTQKRMIFKRIT